MSIGHGIGYLFTAMVSCAAGWAMSGDDDSAAHNAAQPTPQIKVAAPAPPDRGPLIVVASDGNVTLRVEQQPLEWVLEQIALQSGWSDVKERAKASPPGAQNASAPTVASARTPVSSSGDVLSSLLDNDAPERVRLLAFEAYLEPLEDSSDALQSVLQAALRSPSDAIRSEAQRRLDDLRENERIEADASARR